MSTGGRIAALDVLRGVAILGTLASNVWIFTTPGGPAEWISDGFATADPCSACCRLWPTASSSGC